MVPGKSSKLVVVPGSAAVGQFQFPAITVVAFVHVDGLPDTENCPAHTGLTQTGWRLVRVTLPNQPRNTLGK